MMRNMNNTEDTGRFNRAYMYYLITKYIDLFPQEVRTTRQLLEWDLPKKEKYNPLR